MFGLPRLNRHVEDGILGVGSQERWQRLLRRLKADLRLVNRLGLRLPTIPLDDDEDGLIARYVEPNPHKPGVEEAWVVGHEDNGVPSYTIPIWALIGHYLYHLPRNVDDVARAYDVPAEAVEAAVAYYRRHQCAVDTRLAVHAD